MSAVSKQVLIASVLIAGGSGLVLGGVVGCVVGFQLGKPGSATATSGKVYSRDEFSKLVVGKTPAEVIAVLGKPDSTQERSNESGSPTWYFYSRTRDPATGKVDWAAQVWLYPIGFGGRLGTPVLLTFDHFEHYVAAVHSDGHTAKVRGYTVSPGVFRVSDILIRD